MSRTVEALTAVKLVSFKGRVLGARWRRSKSRRKKALMRVLSFTFLSTRTFDFYSLMAWPSIWLLHSFNLLQLIPRYGPSSVVFCIPSPKTHFPTQADDFPSTSGICPIFFIIYPMAIHKLFRMPTDMIKSKWFKIKRGLNYHHMLSSSPKSDSSPSWAIQILSSSMFWR